MRMPKRLREELARRERTRIFLLNRSEHVPGTKIGERDAGEASNRQRRFNDCPEIGKAA